MQLMRGIPSLLAICTLLCAAQDAPKTAPSQPDAMPQPIQPARPKSPTGSLTGSVYCADTNLPARGAQILLIPASNASFGFQGSGITDLDGRFAVKALREGDYYVVASLPGYVNLLTSLRKSHVDSLTDDQRKHLLAQVPTVTISADQPAQISIRLERGAEIDGTVMYDDGSPAIGLEVDYKLKSVSQSSNNPMAEMLNERVYGELLPVKTDDRGRFRLLGVAPGEYLVSAAVPTVSAEQASSGQIAAMLVDVIAGLNVFVGGALRASKAETIKVDAGGASRDADITIPLSKLHTIRGQVVLKSSGQAPPAAMVQLLYADTKELARMAVAPGGEFEMHYVPEGSFILRAAASPDSLPKFAIGDDEDGADSAGGFGIMSNPNPGAIEDSADMPLVVTGDVDYVSISVPDPPSSRQGPMQVDQGQQPSADNPQ